MFGCLFGLVRNLISGRVNKCYMVPTVDLGNRWNYLVICMVNTCPQSPVVILLKSTAPASMTPDGILHEPGVASHRILGSGISLLTLSVKPLPPDQRLARVVLYRLIIFPGDAIP